MAWQSMGVQAPDDVFVPPLDTTPLSRRGVEGTATLQFELMNQHTLDCICNTRNTLSPPRVKHSLPLLRRGDI